MAYGISKLIASNSIICDAFAIWYDLYNLKVVEITHGELLLLVKILLLECYFY